MTNELHPGSDEGAATADRYVEPPDRLIDRIGKVSFAAADVAAAERVVGEIAAGMTALFPEGVARLRSFWGTHGDRLSPETIKGCQAIAHDLAGFGTTLGYPLVTSLSRSLCRFIDQSDLARPGARDVIGAHVAALHAVVRDRLVGDGGEIGKTLVAELSRAIAKFRSR